MFDEEERPKKTVRLFTPAKLEGISVEEMREYVAELKLEATRVEAEIDKRLSHASAAASLFKKLAVVTLLASTVVFTHKGDAMAADNTRPPLVEKQIFSGRENPTWSISEAEAAAIVRDIRELPMATQIPTPQKSLGYTGVVLRTNTGEYKVANGYVESLEGRKTRFHRDEQGRIEKRLLSTESAKEE